MVAAAFDKSDDWEKKEQQLQQEWEDLCKEYGKKTVALEKKLEQKRLKYKFKRLVEEKNIVAKWLQQYLQEQHERDEATGEDSAWTRMHKPRDGKEPKEYLAALAKANQFMSGE